MALLLELVMLLFVDIPTYIRQQIKDLTLTEMYFVNCYDTLIEQSNIEVVLNKPLA